MKIAAGHPACRYLAAMFASLGKAPWGDRLLQLSRSLQYRQGKFHNRHATDVTPSGKMLSIAGEWLRRSPHCRPPAPLPSVYESLKDWHPDQPSLRWFGHSSYLLACSGFRILVDPVFSGHAAPFRPLVSAFATTHPYHLADLPPADLLVLTHDHYDHLDYASIRALRHRVSRIVCPLGVGTHLVHWGVDPALITELDWHEAARIHPQVQLRAMPARHFSGRSTRQFQTLWCSYVLDFFGLRLFLGGDSGYDDQFALTGREYGPFHLALLECGQYGRYWPHIHMFPEETAQAGTDLLAQRVMPVHWARFQLSTHAWNDPVIRFAAAADQLSLPWTMPRIGEAMSLSDIRRDPWWLEVRG